ncbi:efflux RND transporter periplasmic adaptor subunit [Paludibacterium yongneupense]|uniref:HlyD family secretion protein n=1 Tax=Paludibacterium yongneupense TaxID=400061 RepID=UPI00040B6E04|nr:efflux RND transporter periplasmic adaptor subunit [Paludibacterium yongneupense]
MSKSVSNARRRRLFSLLAVVCAVGGASAGAYWFLYASQFVSTDNAYANAEVAQLTASVGGIVSRVDVVDTQKVKKGDVLVVIDSTDARLALLQAQAEYARAVRKVRGLVATDSGLDAQILARRADEARTAAQLKAAQADLDRASIDLKRRLALASSGSVSGEELTQAQNAFVTAQANLGVARSATAQARANREAALGSRDANHALIDNSSIEANPEVALAHARLDQARVDLERTTVRSPIDGVVARRQVQLGQRVQIGAGLLSVVPVDTIHVDANFKEVQLEGVKAGQPAEVHADLYGDSVTYHGVVAGFAGGTGAAFATIPAQNATGNWIKVVQRLPVRIRLDPQELARHPLQVGLSMQVKINTGGKR